MIRQREQSLHFTAPYCRAKEKNATGLLFLCVYLTASRSSMSAARLCLLSVEKCCIDQIFFLHSKPLHLTVDTFVLSFPLPQLYSLTALPLPSSPSLKFSPFPPPLQYPVLSLFSLPWPILFSPVSQPLRAPSSSPPFLNPATPIRLSSVSRSSSALCSSCCLCWQSGRRRRSEA